MRSFDNSAYQFSRNKVDNIGAFKQRTLIAQFR